MERNSIRAHYAIEKKREEGWFYWGWMSSQGGGFFYRFHGILTSEKYVQILENFLVPYAWARFGQTEDNPVPFVQDRSPIHRSYLIRKRFEDQGKEFDVLPWSPKGADTNPIENVCGEMVRSMDLQHSPSSDELWNTVHNIWKHLNDRQNYWRTLCNSMPAGRFTIIREVNGH